MPRLDDAITKALDALRIRQREDGAWDPGCEFDPSCTALYLLLLHYLRRSDAALETEIVRYLRHEQLREGGWGGSPDSDPDLDITVLCYTALRAAGVPAEDEALVRARTVIDGLGGITAIGFMPRVMLRMLGQIPAAALPYFSPRLVDSPWLMKIPILQELAFLAPGIGPLTLFHDECVYALDDQRGVQELVSKNVQWCIRPSGKSSYRRPSPLTSGLSSMAWIVISLAANTSRFLDAIFPPERARRKALQLIRDQQGPDGTFCELIIPTVLSLMALETTGEPSDSESVNRGLRTLETWIVRDERGAWIPTTPSATFFTAQLVEGLTQLPAGDSSALTAARWLFAHQASTPGFWHLHTAKSAPIGGWFFGWDNSLLVDTDDTAIVLNALRRFRHLHPDQYQRGIEWLLAMQDTCGGWAGFTVNLRWLARLPAGFLDPALAASATPDEDITARSIIALQPLCNSSDDPSGVIRSAVQRAVEFLWNRRRPDGTWFGRWAVNYAYGTAQVIQALGQCGLGDDPRVQESARWLDSIQNADGGWGETKLSYRTGHYVPGSSSPMTTAFVLSGLIAGRIAPDATFERAIDYLLESQWDSGLWSDPGWTGVAVPGMTYVSYDPTAQVLGALAMTRDYLRQRQIGACSM